MNFVNGKTYTVKYLGGYGHFDHYLNIKEGSILKVDCHGKYLYRTGTDDYKKHAGHRKDYFEIIQDEEAKKHVKNNRVWVIQLRFFGFCQSPDFDWAFIEAHTTRRRARMALNAIKKQHNLSTYRIRPFVQGGE